ncbi:hypothetical protein [Halosimplex sp. J119]
MPSKTTNYDRDAFKTLVETVKGAGWEFSGGQVVQRFTNAARDERGEETVTFTLPGTGARLRVTCPDRTRRCLCRFGLVVPLDEGLGFGCDNLTFVGDLCDVHHAIARRHVSPYLTPEAEPNLILHGRVPRDFDENDLVEAFTACERAGREADRCHTLIYDIFKRFGDPDSDRISD